MLSVTLTLLGFQGCERPSLNNSERCHRFRGSASILGSSVARFAAVFVIFFLPAQADLQQRGAASAAAASSTDVASEDRVLEAAEQGGDGC